ncbi:hypothetical protein N7541_006413 [Penicillium brevicompactum]|uniref:Uncharacterized protein n=1 Tax=Penicillium brevicompactum TaxID=5074 RepID=A0A9W9R734_PENBR|nr:hypothetical protein N7541_006413 [Penicillium brevicompactum]
MMFLCHVKATHITDYSEVSGFYGPGTFWAWILVCAMAFGPNEGRVLLRHIWSGPIVGLEHACIFDPDIRDLPLPQDMEEGSVESRGRDLDSGYKIDREKLCKLRRLLDSIFCVAFLGKKGKPKLITEVLRLCHEDSDFSLWRYYPHHISTAEVTYRLHKNYEKATGERAEKILSLCSEFNLSLSKCQSGFVEYHSRGFAHTDGFYFHFFKGLRAEFPWLRMGFDNFHFHLIDLRNRFQYLQYRRELRELSPRLDANTCAAVAYPLIACCVQLKRHIPFQNQRWEAQDEAVASVAQLSSTISFFAIMSNRPSFSYVTLRHVAWMTVLLCSLKVLSCRVQYVCMGRSFSNHVASFQMLGFVFIIMIDTLRFPVAKVLAWCFPAQIGQPQPSPPPVIQLALMCFIPIVAFLGAKIDRSQLDTLCAVSSWDVHFSPPIPRSSTSLGELDQGAGLATAIFLLFLTPLQRGLSTLDRNFFFRTLRVFHQLFVYVITWSQEKYHKMKRAFEGSIFETRDNNDVELSDMGPRVARR